MHNSQRNREAERTIGIIKCLLNKKKDPCIATYTLLSYPIGLPSLNRNSKADRRQWCLFQDGRESQKSWIRIQTESLQAQEEEINRNQKKNFEVTSVADVESCRYLPELEEAELVWIFDQQAEIVVQEETEQPAQFHTMHVSTPDGTVKHNRRDLVQIQESNMSNETSTAQTATMSRNS